MFPKNKLANKFSFSKFFSEGPLPVMNTHNPTENRGKTSRRLLRPKKNEQWLLVKTQEKNRWDPIRISDI